MKKLRRFVLGLLIAAAALLLGGCAYMDSCVEVSVTGIEQYDPEKLSVDLLLPIEDDDEFFREFIGNESFPKISADSGIASYNEDGFRSMLFHLDGTDSSIYIRDKNDLKPDNPGYDGSPCRIDARIRQTRFGGQRSGDPYGEEEFMCFCSAYKKCRIAVFDSDGNIVYTSRSIRLTKLCGWINDAISVNVNKDEVHPRYIMDAGLLLIICMCGLCSCLGVLIGIIMLIAYNVRCNRMKYDCRGFYIISVIFALPAAAYLIMTAEAVLSGAAIPFSGNIDTSGHIFLIPAVLAVLIAFNFRKHNKEYKSSLK